MKLSTFTTACDLIAQTPFGATSARILVAIHQRPGISMVELATISLISTAAITGQMDRLHELGYTTRRHDTVDRRKIIATLTPKGQAFVQGIIAAEEPK